MKNSPESAHSHRRMRGWVPGRRKSRKLRGASTFFAYEASARQSLRHRTRIPVLHSDSLASVTFAPDQLLLTLTLAGIVATSYSLWVGALLAVVMAIVVGSYRQTLRAYPRGGDYAVVKKNLGPFWGLLVGCALLVDSVLLTAILLSTATQFIVALFPQFGGYQPVMASGAVVLLGVGAFAAPLKNVRTSHVWTSTRWLGTLSSYFFLTALVMMVLVGVIQNFTTGLAEAPSGLFDLARRPEFSDGLVGVGGVYLFGRAFASAATSLSGVSAISNGVATFPRPQASNAVRSLSFLAAFSISLTIAILWLAGKTHLTLLDDPSRVFGGMSVNNIEPHAFAPSVAQLAQAIYGRESFGFVVTVALTIGMLLTAAVTVYRAFPALIGTLSADSFLPRQFHMRSDGRRSIASLFLFSASIIVFILVFNAQQARLIHVYFFGLFLALTLSQFGMIRHWNRALRTRQTGQERSQVIRVRAINIIGFLMTALALGVVLGTKFAYGVWISVSMILALFLFQRAIHHYYAETSRQMAVDTTTAPRVMPTRVHAIVITPSFSQLTELTVATARATAPSSLELLAVVASAEDEHRIRKGWENSGISAPLTLLSSPTRQITPTIVEHVEALRKRRPQELVMVYVPYVIVRHWWLGFMHNQSGKALHKALMHIPGVVVTSVPWHMGATAGEHGETVNDPYHEAWVDKNRSRDEDTQESEPNEHSNTQR